VNVRISQVRIVEASGLVVGELVVDTISMVIFPKLIACF